MKINFHENNKSFLNEIKIRFEKNNKSISNKIKINSKKIINRFSMK